MTREARKAHRMVPGMRRAVTLLRDDLDRLVKGNLIEYEPRPSDAANE